MAGNSAAGNEATGSVLGVIRVVAGVLAPPAAFYAVGYLIIHAYVSTTRLMAGFWFTESFYRDAGATFLIDILMSVALLPHVFLTLSALLIALFPGETDGGARWLGYSGFYFQLSGRVRPVLRRRAFYGSVALALLLAVRALQDCQALRCDLPYLAPWFTSAAWVVGDETLGHWLDYRPRLLGTALFFALTIPTLVALGVLALRVLLRQMPAPGQAMAVHETHPFAALLLAGAFAVLTVFLPVSYGAVLYDLTGVSLVDKARCMKDPPQADGQADTANAADPGVSVEECYLVGRFDTRYILIGKQVRTERATAGAGGGPGDPAPLPGGYERISHSLYIKQIDRLEPFEVEPQRPRPLRDVVVF